jgi:hypothetical protein
VVPDVPRFADFEGWQGFELLDGAFNAGSFGQRFIFLQQTLNA